MRLILIAGNWSSDCSAGPTTAGTLLADALKTISDGQWQVTAFNGGSIAALEGIFYHAGQMDGILYGPDNETGMPPSRFTDMDRSTPLVIIKNEKGLFSALHKSRSLTGYGPARDAVAEACGYIEQRMSGRESP